MALSTQTLPMRQRSPWRWASSTSSSPISIAASSSSFKLSLPHKSSKFSGLYHCLPQRVAVATKQAPSKYHLWFPLLWEKTRGEKKHHLQVFMAWFYHICFIRKNVGGGVVKEGDKRLNFPLSCKDLKWHNHKQTKGTASQMEKKLSLFNECNTWIGLDKLDNFFRRAGGFTSTTTYMLDIYTRTTQVWPLICPLS